MNSTLIQNLLIIALSSLTKYRNGINRFGVVMSHGGIHESLRIDFYTKQDYTDWFFAQMKLAESIGGISEHPRGSKRQIR